MYQAGDKIVFRYTGLEAEIIESFQDGSYQVWILEDNEEGLAFEDDIVLKSKFSHIEQSEVQKQRKKKKKLPSTEEIYFGASSVNYKQKKPSKESKATNQEIPVQQVPKFEFTAGTQSGCHLVFVPTNAQHYTIYIVNDLPISFGFEFKLLLNQQLVHGFNKTIAANQFFPIGEFLTEQFNDQPAVLFKSQSLNQAQKIKLKYNKFIKQLKMIPLMGIEAYGFNLFKHQNPYLSKQTSLKEYTNDQKGAYSDYTTTYYTKHSLNDIANFDPELDLHAEKIVSDTSEYSSAELYELQLNTLEKYMNKAVQLGIKIVYIIHGLGKGRLQEGVANYLKYHDNVLHYKNEFHEKYGFGATKVTLKD